jgi:hypothetical protein
MVVIKANQIKSNGIGHIHMVSRYYCECSEMLILLDLNPIENLWRELKVRVVPATAPKHHCSRGDLHGGMGQNTSNSV